MFRLPYRSARREPIPRAAGAVQDLDDVDYADAYTVEITPGDSRSAEEWARAILESLPRIPNAALLGLWSLFMRPGPPHSRDHVLGLRIRERSPHAIVLQPDTKLGDIRLVLITESTERQTWLHLASFGRFGGWQGRVGWAFTGPLHRRVAPLVLGRAAALYANRQPVLREATVV